MKFTGSWLALFGLLVGCRGGTDDSAQAQGVRAIVDSDRSEHFFDVPFPSDSLVRADGSVDLTGYPLPAIDPARGLVEGWVRRTELAAPGFGNNTGAFFRFEGPLPAFDDGVFTTEGKPSDPVVWVSLDGAIQVPLEGRFVEDPDGDPFYGPNTLAVTPALGHPLPSGHTWVVAVLEGAGAAPATGSTLPDGVAQALRAAGIDDAVAVATVFTPQDPTAMLRALAADVESRPAPPPVAWKEVVALEYVQDQTPSGKDATRATTVFADGTRRDAWLAPGATDRTVDLTDWPMVVYEGELQTWNYQGLEGRPWMSPGFTSLFVDADRDGGWMPFDASGQLVGDPVAEPMRVVLSLPRDGAIPGDARGVVIHDHGTGGHAYNIVQRRSSADDGLAIQTTFAEAGWATIGRDAALYGTRFGLIDEGYDASFGFYNIANAPAFRDNQRQTAVDGHVLRQYIASGLLADLPGGSVDIGHVRRTGHSLGSVTANLGLAMAPDQYEAGFVSGTGGIFGLYFLETGLLGSIDPTLVSGIFALVGAEPPDDPTPQTILGALLGLPDTTWDRLDRLHPSLMLFQWQMDPSDPMAVVRDETLPVTFLVAPGDRQTLDFTGEALEQAAPDGTLVRCEALGTYDPHYCFWREQEGYDALADWLDTDFQGP